MRNEEDLDALFQQCAYDLSGNLRALPIVRRGKGFAKEQHGIGRQVLDDTAHSAQFFIKFAALHGRVFFPLVVGKDPFAHVGTERLGWHKHAALHHQLGHTDASEKCRLSALVRTSDDYEVFMVGIELVAHDFMLET